MLAQTFVKSLHRSLDLASFYEPGDKMISAITDPLSEALARLDPGAAIRLEVDGQRLVCAGESIAGDDATALTEHFIARGIVSVTFAPELARSELWTFLVLLSVVPTEIHTAGGFQRWLDRFGCVGLDVNIEAAEDVPNSQFLDPPWANRSRNRVPTRVFDPDKEPS